MYAIQIEGEAYENAILIQAPFKLEGHLLPTLSKRNGLFPELIPV